MGRAVAIAVMACSFGVFGTGTLSAQEIFWDGFDEGDLCAWTNPPVTVYQEQEAFDEGGANDDLADAEPIGRCAIVEGTIGDPYDIDPGQGEEFVPDTDYYEVDIQGPALLRVRLERIGEASDLRPAGLVVYEDNNYAELGLTACDPVDLYPATTSRQFYLPENGFDFEDPIAVGAKSIPSNNKWYINVDDGRNFDLCGLGFSEYVGGVGFTYRLTLSIDPVAGSQLFFPYIEEPVQMPEDGSLPIYRIDGSAVTTLDGAETFIDRSQPGLLDTKLYLVKKVGSQLVTVAGNDDFNFDVGGFDSKLSQQALTANPHFVIVDNFGKYLTGPIDFDLTIQYLQTLWH